MKIKRIYHRYDKLEEFHAGLWKIIHGDERQLLLEKAIKFTGDADLYGEYMMRVLDDWPISCEHNLSCQDMNRQAWIGHAATCIATGCPEDITRIAWHSLSKEQQDKANAKADQAIMKWERIYAEKAGRKNAKEKLGNQLLFGF